MRKDGLLKIKRIIVITIINILILNFSNIIAQQGFELIVDDSVASVPNCTKYFDGNLYIVGGKIYPGFRSSFFIKVTPDGEYTEKVFGFGGDTACILVDVEFAQDGFLLFGKYGIKESNAKEFNHIWIIKLDNQLNTVFEKKYKVQKDFWNPLYKVTRNNNGIIYLIGTLGYQNILTKQNFFRMKLNDNGDTLMTKYFYDSISLDKRIYSVLSKSDNNGVYAFGINFYVATPLDFIEVDSNLNYTYQPIEDPEPGVSTMGSPLSARWFDDETILLSGMVYNPQKGNNEDYELALLDLDCNFITKNIFGKPDTNDYPGWFKSADLINNNEIFFTGSIQHAYNQSKNAAVQVYVTDENLNIKGMKYYGGEQNYSVMTTTATPDGGCVIGGTIHNWQDSSALDVDVWIKKVFADEIVSNSEDTPNPFDMDVLVYPNPFDNRLILKTIRKGLVFSLFNINGEKILETEIKNSNMYFELNTNSLKKGIYIFKIMNQNNIIQTGKLTKTI